jgi:hypothetical protein
LEELIVTIFINRWRKKYLKKKFTRESEMKTLNFDRFDLVNS